ncbi:hypothetical protein BASA81_004227 [Batrachochytrium salamandrivorans]|nr:hypothetical protein BASA81_004227 [Batrachochytrium salamandrivorans]
MHVLVVIDVAAMEVGGEDRVSKGLGRMFSEDFDGNPLSRISAKEKLYSVRLFDASTGKGVVGGGDLFEEAWALPRFEGLAPQVVATATATRELEQQNCKHIQLVSHAAFSSLAKHDEGDCIVLVGSRFPQTWLDAARSISQSKSFPGAGGVEFVFVDVNRVVASNRVVELDEMLTAKPSQQRKKQRLAAAAASHVVPIVETKVDVVTKKQLRSARDILQGLESGALENGELKFSDFAQAALMLERSHELAETLLAEPKFVHLGLVLLGRDSANVGRIKPLLIGLSIAWNQAERFTRFLKEEWRPYCSEEVWQMVRRQFLEEEEAAVARPQMAAKSSVLDKVNLLNAAAATVTTPKSHLTVAQATPPAPSFALVAPKIPLVLLKRNGQRAALNHFVGDYLSNPAAHFRQVRQPTATAAKKPKPAVTTTVAASPLRVPLTCVPESPVASRTEPRLVMETPPPATTSKRASAKRLFQE